MTHNGNTNETCSTCGQVLTLRPLLKDTRDGNGGGGRAWRVGHYCNRCQRWGRRLKGAWPTRGQAERAMEGMR